MERIPARAQSPRAIFALGVSVIASFISRLLTGIKQHATTSRCKITNNLNPDSVVADAPTRWSYRIQRESLQMTASLPHAYPALSGFHSQDMMVLWASSHLNARSHSGSYCHHYALGVACSIYERNRRRAIDSTRLRPWDNRPRVKYLRTRVEL